MVVLMMMMLWNIVLRAKVPALIVLLSIGETQRRGLRRRQRGERPAAVGSHPPGSLRGQGERCSGRGRAAAPHEGPSAACRSCVTGVGDPGHLLTKFKDC